MAFPTTFASVVTSPGGTGSTITPTLPSHTFNDVIEIYVGKTGNVGWSAPAGWSIRQQLISPGTASTACVGTLLYRKVLPGDTLPLTSPVCNLGATVTRAAIALTKRSANVDGVHSTPAWTFAATSGTANPIRPPSITTQTPDALVHHYYCARVATNAPEPASYTQVQEVVISGTLVLNVAERNIAASNTVLSNQDASPTSGGRWVGMIAATPPLVPAFPLRRGSFGQDARLRR